MSADTIRDVETSLLHIPRPPVTSAIGTHHGITVITVQLRTEEGREGLGWTNVLGSGAAAIKHFLDDEFVPMLEGRRPHDVRALWTEMFRASLTRGRKGVPLYAMSAVDIALWDLVALEAELAIHDLFGAVQDSVPVYGNGCWTSLTMDELLAEAQRYVDMGLVGVKVKIGGDLRTDLARIDAVRDVVGEDRHIMIDANQRYDVVQAERVAHELADRGVYWFEEPILADSVQAYARLARRTRVPIATGENEYSRFGFRDLIEADGVHILQPDIHRVGGITEFLRIANLAETFDLPVAPHTSWELQGQLLVTCSTGLVLEYYDWFPEDFFTESFEIIDGHLAPSSTPGIGARIAPDSFEKYGVD